MIKAELEKRTFHFLKPAGTSRGYLLDKPSWFLVLRDEQVPGPAGVGECSLIPGLSPDPPDRYEDVLRAVCLDPAHYHQDPSLLSEFPSIRMGLETAWIDLLNGGTRQLFPGPFSRGEAGIPINGLIWMGSPDYIKAQIKTLLDKGFRCLKMKIGAMDLEEEVAILGKVRQSFGPADLELRVDANGAFQPEQAQVALSRLEKLQLHSIEQPIPPGRPDLLASLCRQSQVPIALDEELFLGNYEGTKAELVRMVLPAYLVLKPSLLGGFRESEAWIAAANEAGVPWWVTSALESNIGLNAIAQWTSTLSPSGYQGLGTGSLYANNVPSPLFVHGGNLFYGPHGNWIWP